MKKCQFCKNGFKEKEYHDDFEEKTCFSCRVIFSTIVSFKNALVLNSMASRKSKEYWSKKLNTIIENK
jgi:hypothetical protein